MNLTIEAAVMVQTEGDSYLLWTPLVDRAAVQWQGDSVWYTANFDLAAYVQLRLTLRANFTYGIPVPTGSQVYVVDTGAPRIVGVTPDPQVTLPIGSSPTFTVDFEEVGNTTLDPASIHLWLETANSQLVQGTFTSSLDGAQRTGYARLVIGAPLDFGHYRLYVEVADVAGNRATANWTYEVGYTADTPARLLDNETAYNYPNPFGPNEPGREITHFWLPVTPGAGAHVEIKVYDFSGMFVATIYEGYLMPGAEIEWTGRNGDGQMVANGVYLAHVITSADGKSKEDIVKVAFKNEK
jgi:hypothetical protein